MAAQTPALSVADVAYRWSVSKDVVYDMLNTGELKGFKVRDLWRISPEEIEAFENRATTDVPEVKTANPPMAEKPAQKKTIKPTSTKII